MMQDYLKQLKDMGLDFHEISKLSCPDYKNENGEIILDELKCILLEKLNGLRLVEKRSEGEGSYAALYEKTTKDKISGVEKKVPYILSLNKGKGQKEQEKQWLIKFYPESEDASMDDLINESFKIYITAGNTYRDASGSINNGYFELLESKLVDEKLVNIKTTLLFGTNPELANVKQMISEYDMYDEKTTHNLKSSLATKAVTGAYINRYMAKNIQEYLQKEEITPDVKRFIKGYEFQSTLWVTYGDTNLGYTNTMDSFNLNTHNKPMNLFVDEYIKQKDIFKRMSKDQSTKSYMDVSEDIKNRR